MTQTGANADEWVPAAPGSEGMLALGLAHVILREKLRPAGAAGRAGRLIFGWSEGLSDYTPDRVEKATGVAAHRLERLAREFAARRPAVAIIGGPPLAHTNGLFNAIAVNALNALAGNVGEAGGLFFTPQISPQSAGRGPQSQSAVGSQQSLQKLAADIVGANKSPVQALLIDGVNPIFTTPRAWKVREALEKVPFITSFGSFLDDTSSLSDLILPDHSFLESWVDSVPESGSLVAVVGVAAPAMHPLHETRATGRRPARGRPPPAQAARPSVARPTRRC